MKLFLIISIVILLLGFTIVFMQKPSNTRDWEAGFEILPETKISQDQKQVTIKNLRNWNYSKTDIISREYDERTYNLDNLEKVWFMREPFSGWDGIAHTYFIFDFADQDPVSFSIEARREKGEKYNGFVGVFNKYELIYLWGTERDFTGRRAYKDEDKLYMYPLIMDKEVGQKLFIELAKYTETLRNNPEFYNTLTSNCTNNLVKHVNNIRPGTIPFHYAQILPGYSDELLYRLKYIPTDQSLAEINKKYYITNIVNEIYNDVDFSKELRDRLK